jgi:hypothetical protein
VIISVVQWLRLCLDSSPVLKFELHIILAIDGGVVDEERSIAEPHLR